MPRIATYAICNLAACRNVGEIIHYVFVSVFPFLKPSIILRVVNRLPVLYDLRCSGVMGFLVVLLFAELSCPDCFYLIRGMVD
jgi:hypothetical protein